MQTRILRRHEVEKKTGLSRSTIYALMTKGEFPKQIRLTAKAVGWFEASIDAWLASRVSSEE